MNGDMMHNRYIDVELSPHKRAVLVHTGDSGRSVWLPLALVRGESASTTPGVKTSFPELATKCGVVGCCIHFVAPFTKMLPIFKSGQRIGEN